MTRVIRISPTTRGMSTTATGNRSRSGRSCRIRGGLYDMHGNVFEWCQDWYAAYPGGITLDPQGPETGWGRVIRGGRWSFWDVHAQNCRSAARGVVHPDGSYGTVGFRVVLAPSQP